MSNQTFVPAIEAAPARSQWGTAVWSVVAAFGVYFCMYAFRQPFKSATFATSPLWGQDEKSVLVIAQVFGYMVSKFIGIRVIAEMQPQRRAIGILILIGWAELALLLFAVVPSPYHVVCLFLNGLPLGMIFGLVLGFLEGRRHTEALTAGLCASFILADGVTRSIGSWLLSQQVHERWMPCFAGLVFVPPLLFFLWMLSRITPPTAADMALRSERVPMTRFERNHFLWTYGPGLLPLVIVYLLVTIVRTFRSDFSTELWIGLGRKAAPDIFWKTELCVALGILLVNGLSVLIRDNRRAFFTSLGISMLGMALLACALSGLRLKELDDFSFMVLLGLGLYLPYVAVHTTVFERMIAMTRERGNLGFLMYVADAVGYLGYVAVILGKTLLPKTGDVLGFFTTTTWIVVALSAISLVWSWVYFLLKTRAPQAQISPLPRREGAGVREVER